MLENCASSKIESLERIFSLVAQVPRDNQETLLDELCPDSELRAQVRSLLSADSSTGQFLDKSLYAEKFDFRSGDRIGSYKLLQEIGQGGMGVVYMAEQLEPVRRKVALKVIKPGVDTQQVIARFEAERQALSMMDHPNIAKVFEAGATDTGRPYFVMELVKGKPICDYCDDQQLSTQERLKIFVAVCHAIQHAHQKGIIHRDVKPSNVLVAEYDGQPVPKVIDFGVAKAVDQPLTEMTMFTGFGQIIGTFEYMSPEQSRVNQLDVDTRSDIYSLGVLLYELLTGSTPFDKERLRSAAWDEMLRIIREEDPPKPSTRLSENMRPRPAGKQRENELVKLNRVVRGELDWIVMKAMEKNRNRRYNTPHEFAHDVQCYLDGEPVTACPPSTAYRFQKFARRHRLALSVSALVAACLLFGLVGTSLQAFRAMRAEKKALAEMDLKELARQEALTSAEQARAAAAAERLAREAEQLQRQKAEAASVVAANEAAMAKAISQFLQRDLLGLAGAEAQLAAGMEIDPDVKLVTLLKRALDRVDERFADQPRIRIQIMATLSRSFERIGQYAEAAQLLEEISEFLKINFNGEHPETLRIENNLAALYIYQGRLRDAEPLLKKTLQARRLLKGNEHTETLASMSNLAVLYKMQGRFEEAEPLYRECLETERRKLGDDHEETAKTMGNLALLYQEMSRLDDAERLFTEALEVNRRVLPPTHPKIAVALSNLGVLYRKRDHHEDALAVLSEAVEIQERACGAEHPDTITTKANLASLYKAQGRYDLAEPIFTDALERLRRKLGNDHSRTLSQINNLGLLYMEQERFDAAMPLLVEALETGRRVLSSKHPDTLLYVSNLGVLLRRSGRLEESLALHEEAWRLRKEVLGPDHVDTITSMANLGLTYLDAGNAAEGIRLLEEVQVTSKKAAEFGWIRTKLADAYAKDGKIPQAIDLIVEQIDDARKSSPIDRQRFANILASCGFRLLKLEAWQEAEPVLRESLTLREELSPDTWATFNALSMLGEALLGQKRYTQAEPLLLDGHAGLIQQGDSNPQEFDSRVRLAVGRLIRLYEATKNAEEADKWKAELEDLGNEGLDET